MTIQEAQQQLLFQLFHIYEEREARNIADLVMEHVTEWKRIDRASGMVKVRRIKPIIKANMRRIIVTLFGLIFIAQTFAAAPADPNPQSDKSPADAETEDERESRKLLNSINWKRGPAEADVGSYAKVKVPEGYWFTAGDGTRKLMEAYGNLTTGNELGFLSPTNLEWFVIFKFSDVGYVKDDDKDKLDAEKLLETRYARFRHLGVYEEAGTVRS